MFQLGLISACSQNETVTFDEQFNEIMFNNNIALNSVWHFEVKGNYIVIFYEKESHLNIGFIESSDGQWELKSTMGGLHLDQNGYLATGEMMELPFNFTAVIHPEENVKGISVLGENAKLVQISPEKKVWFAFTDDPAYGYELEE